MADRNARQEAPSPQPHGEPMFNWPHDEDGWPLAMVTMGVSELYGIPGTYSNVLVGPAQATLFVGPLNPVDDAMLEAIRQGVVSLQGALEQVMAESRETTLEIIAQVKAGTGTK